MSLVPYNDGSIILNDPSSRSLAIVDPKLGSVSVYQQINAKGGSRDLLAGSISSYLCPHCGAEIHLSREDSYPSTLPSDIHESSADENQGNSRNNNFMSTTTGSNIYFQLLQRNHKYYAIQDGNTSFTCIPDDLFIPGYFHKFFEILEPLGNGARGSVYKVIHKLGSTQLGTYALKKIPIGNDDTWFNKCIREVKALSSLQHKSGNLITYNHVWMEMDDSVGHVRAMDIQDTEDTTKVPCMFILQQYCSGGNLEDCINEKVFIKDINMIPIEERKKQFRELRKNGRKNEKEKGLTSMQIISILLDISTGLHELHDIGLIHRDLKPSNCLLMEPYSSLEYESISVEIDDMLEETFPTIVIGDFGESQMKGECRSATGATGTMEFTAPEVIIDGNNRESSSYHEFSYASDMYSLGMIGYFIVFGELPFKDNLDLADLKKDIKSLTIKKVYMIEKHKQMKLKKIDYHIFDILERLLDPDERKRLTAKECEHILKKLQDMIRKDYIPVKEEEIYREEEPGAAKKNGDYEKPGNLLSKPDSNALEKSVEYYQLSPMPVRRLSLPDINSKQHDIISIPMIRNLPKVLLLLNLFIALSLYYFGHLKSTHLNDNSNILLAVFLNLGLCINSSGIGSKIFLLLIQVLLFSVVLYREKLNS
ncbi:putative serine/threonine-protein kinase IKS1 [Nakaseomyces bracarensis]|uniref:Serine/threonine-protein kinase IKS1 n=1 Tax=Nakaseomyces bracarensis TaxID=273131 RepID=A0ABR4NVI2_9SACH